MNTLTVLILIHIYFTIFYGFFLLVLRHDTRHKLNRVFMYLILLLSLTLPFIDVNAYLSILFPSHDTTLPSYTLEQALSIQVTQINSYYNWVEILVNIYFLVSALFFCKAFITFVHTYLDKARLHSKAYSFFNFVKVNADLPYYDTILAHEQAHVRLWHSLDLFIFEILCTFLWPNPLVIYLKKDLRNIQEFEADKIAAQKIGTKSYCYLLLSQTLDVSPQVFVNQFFEKATIKQRIIMLTKTPSQSPVWLKFGFGSVAFIGLVVGLSSFVNKDKIKPQTQKLGQEISQVVEGFNVRKEVKSFLIAESEKQEESEISISKSDTLVKPSAKAKYIVNGIEVNNLDGFRPEDIESISVLKAKNTNGILGSDGKYDIIQIKLKNNIENQKDKSNVFNVIVPKTDESESSKVNVQLDKEIKNGEMEKLVSSVPQEEEVFSAAEKVAQFPGGNEALYKYLGENIIYPKDAQINKVSGRVFVKFIVEKNGAISNITIVKGIGSGCDEETKRVIKSMSKWLPAQQNGKIVRSYYTMPVNYQLD